MTTVYEDSGWWGLQGESEDNKERHFPCSSVSCEALQARKASALGPSHTPLHGTFMYLHVHVHTDCMYMCICLLYVHISLLCKYTCSTCTMTYTVHVHTMYMYM